MFGKSLLIRFLIAYSLIISNIPLAIPVQGQDIVASDDLTSGSSVFVFRESRKKPQERAASGKASFTRGKAGLATRKRMDAHIAANWRKKRTAPAATNRAAQTAALKRRIAASTALTAQADKYLDNKETDKAIAAYRDAIKQYPKNTDATSGLSEALTAKGIEVAGQNNDIAAVTFLDEAVKLDSTNEIAFAKLGEIYDAADQTPKAITNYESAVKVKNSFPAVYVPLGLAYFKQGEIAKAETFANRASTDGISGADLEYLRGLVYFRQNKNSEALASFNKAIELEPDFMSAFYYRGQVLDRLNKDDESIASLKKSIEEDPTFAPAWFDLGVIYYNKGDYQNASNAYQQSIKYDESNALAHAYLASAYRQLEQYPEANKEYWLAEEKGMKNNADLYSEWGYCLGKTHEWTEATARLDEAHQLSPTAIDNTNVGWGYYNAAQADKAEKKDAEATAKLEKSKASLETATKQDPKLDAAYMNLGSTNNALGNYDAAVVALNAALSLHSDWVIALNQLGLGYRGMNNLQMALNQFNRAVTIDGNYVNGLFNLGSTQYAAGDKKGAKKTQDRLRRLSPALADQLGNIIAGKLIEAGTNEIKKKIRIPGIPY
jgi:tetratricopeptide (TPR) repeat protein